MSEIKQSTKRTVRWGLVGLAALAMAALVPAVALAQPGMGGGPCYGRGGGQGAGAGYGRGGGHGRGMHRGESMRALFAQLDLSAEQRSKLQALRVEHQRAMRVHRDAIVDARREMRDEWQSDSPDARTLHRLQDKVHAAQSQLASARIDNRLACLAVLTPEQRAQAQELREARWNQRGKRGAIGPRGHGQGWGGQGPGMGYGAQPMDLDAE